MPRQSWSNKRERQYEHVKDSERERGRSPQRSEEIAARTVNKQRSRSGEARSTGGRGRSSGQSKEQLYNEAKRRNIKGRSSMTKAELERALR
ncbi:plasmid stabilization protein [Dactylosporangium sp. CA-092794]|uniref:plasmid stabilization protein n=1 Tax=Dactylosporangium sp. CA-092794 TaxID=3239929 RepID=UPI003D8BF134